MEVGTREKDCKSIDSCILISWRYRIIKQLFLLHLDYFLSAIEIFYLKILPECHVNCNSIKKKKIVGVNALSRCLKELIYSIPFKYVNIISVRARKGA